MQSDVAKDEDMATLLSCVELFINTYENFHELLLLRSTEEIKNAFKLSNTIEQAFAHFESTESTARWMQIVRKYFAEKSKSHSYTVPFFSKACDHLLKQVFSKKSTDINVIDISIRIYTSLLPRSRFQAFLCNFLISSESHKAILDFTLANRNNSSDIRKLEYQLTLNQWCIKSKRGMSKELAITVSDMLKYSQVENNLHILIGILAIKSTDQEEQQIKNLIMKIVLSKMMDRSVLSKSFWLTMFKINKEDLLQACDISEEFLESLCNFLIYIGSMMEKETKNGQIQWIGNANISICPELSYNDLLAILKLLTDEKFSKRYFTLRKIKEAKHYTESPLWSQIIHDFNWKS